MLLRRAAIPIFRMSLPPTPGSLSASASGLVTGSKVLQSLLAQKQQKAAAASNVGYRTYSTVPTEENKADVLARYREKLEKKAQEQGLKDISELKTAYADKIEKVKQAQAVPDAIQMPEELPSAQPTSTSTSTSTPTAASSAKSSGGPPGVPTLEKYLNIEKIKTLPAEEVGQLWRLRHSTDKSSLAAVIPIDIWKHMLTTGRKHPQFLIPLPKQVPADQVAPSEGTTTKGADAAASATTAGAELHFLQWTFPDSVRTSILFTQLAEYKLRGEFSTPHTTLTVHSDLAESHGIVLLHGTVTEDRGGAITADDARFLMWGMQAFYTPMAKGERREVREGLLSAFTGGDGEKFSLEALMSEVERIV